MIVLILLIAKNTNIANGCVSYLESVEISPQILYLIA